MWDRDVDVYVVSSQFDGSVFPEAIVALSLLCISSSAFSVPHPLAIGSICLLMSYASMHQHIELSYKFLQ